MSERTDYPHGVPNWVDTMQPDARKAADFYAELFGWELHGSGPIDDAGNEYYVARLRGKDVAGVGPNPGTFPTAWTTYVRVDDVKASLDQALAAGGKQLSEIVDASPAGQLAVLADPAGAAVGLWQAEDREGALVVNEHGAWSMSALNAASATVMPFYESLFGWQADEFAPGVAVLRRPGYFGGEPSQPVPRDVVAVLAEQPGAPVGWSVDFWIDDADAAADRATANGATLLAEPFDDQIFRRAIIQDPQGAVLQLSQLVPERMG